MQSDGRTLPRGRPAGTDHQPPAWPEATAPASRRLPGTTRERKPALAALALLLIVGGALGAGYLVLQSGHRVAAIEISQRIAGSMRIPLTAMRRVEVAAGAGLEYVPWSEASQVAHHYAAITIPPGTLLTSAMVVSSSTVTEGRAVMGLTLKDGQLPGGLQVGDHIDIFEASNSTPVCPGVPGEALAQDAVVLAVTSPPAVSGGSGTDVEVALPPADAGRVACSAANGIVAVAVLPASAAPPTASSPAPHPLASTPPPSTPPPSPAAATPSPAPSATG